jgi:hypothetical protein
MAEVVEAVVVREIAARDNTTLVALERAQIDHQVATAKAYPRSLQEFKETALAMATLDVETAESMTYAIPRDGKVVEGPSVRLAEIAGSCWGNTRYGARVIEVGDEFLTARGMCIDLQRNVAIEIDIRRSIVGKRGRFNSSMIQTVGQAACAIALRNAIFKVVPMAFIKPIMEQAKKVAAGDVKSLNQRRDAALLWFKEKGVKAEQVLGLLGVHGKDDVTLSHIAQMSAIRTAIKDGEGTLEDFFKSDSSVVVSAALDLTPASVKAEDDPKDRETARADAPVIEATLVEDQLDPKPNPKKAKKNAPEQRPNAPEQRLNAPELSQTSLKQDEIDSLFS